MLPVAVLSSFHFESVPKGRARVLPPQLQKPDNYRAFFVSIAGSFTCSRSRILHLLPVAVLSPFHFESVPKGRARVLPPQLKEIQQKSTPRMKCTQIFEENKKKTSPPHFFCLKHQYLQGFQRGRCLVNRSLNTSLNTSLFHYLCIQT